MYILNHIMYCEIKSQSTLGIYIILHFNHMTGVASLFVL